MKKYGYIYHTFCAASGKHYVGQHVGARFDPFYFGSGKILRYALKKYGEEAFTVTPIKWTDTQTELNIEEMWFIAAYRVQYGRARMYNITDGGEGNRGPRSAETIRKMSEAQKGRNTWSKGRSLSTETRAKMSIARKGQPSSMKGRKHSLEARAKISASMIGKPSRTKGLRLWPNGRTYSVETRARMSASAKERCRRQRSHHL
jgi:group I intron endonuclease